MKNITLTIDGMHCAACALGLEGDLEDLGQVKEVSVDFETKKAIISCDETLYDYDEIEETVKKAGFRVLA